MADSGEEYRAAFGLGSPKDECKTKAALEHALDIRKFEINLYWQRTAYFWALIAAALAGYFAILSAEHLDDKKYLAYIVSCIGVVFTWAWFLVNRGSKFWQENWENHVDMLEDGVIGPLYKTVLYRRPENLNFSERHLTGPKAVSVSRINQWVSLFTVCIWLVLLKRTLRDSNGIWMVSRGHVVIGLTTVAFCVLMYYGSRSKLGFQERTMIKRESRIRKTQL